MAKQQDLYAILGVAKTATADEIRKAYRKLARQHHPDLNPGNKQAEERFKEISLAHDALSDPERRKLYDEFGQEGLAPGFDATRAREYRRWADSGQGFSFRGGSPGAGAGDFDFGFGTGTRRGRRRSAAETERGFADILNEMFGGAAEGAAPEPPPSAPRDVEYPIEIDLLDALRGTRTAVSVRRPVVCETCGGTGRVGRKGCTTCGGSGTVEKREKLNVKIPAGVADGARVRVAGKGGVGAGGRSGDLYFVVKVRPHPLLQREGRDLMLEVPITVVEAVRGATIEVPTLAGKVQLKVAPGSQSGQRLRLRGRGAPDPKGGEAGDLYVRLMIQVPRDGAGEKMDDALQALEAAYGGESVRAHLAL
ncbi:MAG: J domain-containing protein [bacterium]|nr:J domain-containing protein [bacterium]